MSGADLPRGFDGIDLAELFDLLDSFLEFPRIGTPDEQDGEREVWDRAHQVLARYRSAS